MRRLLLLLLACCVPCLGPAAEEKREEFADHVGALAAADGVVIATNSDAFPYSIRLVGADASKVALKSGQVLVSVKGIYIRNTVAWIPEFKMKERGDDEKVLAAHLEWEVADLNDMTKQHLTARPEFLDLQGRKWAHWTYDISAFAKTLKPGSGGDWASHQKTQHILSTVLGQYVVVFVAVCFDDQREEDIRDALVKAAKTFVAYPKALTPEQMEELAKKKSP